MIYLLDTNIVSYWMRGDRRLIEKIKRHKPSELSVSTITLAEIYYGIERSPVKKRERRNKIRAILSQLSVLPFNESAALTYAQIRAGLERQGSVISERDIQIAAIAAANKLILVTHNVKEFSRIVNLKWEDWANEG
jgi:tRNA(fMet)-specific endonuclease VapC